MFDRDRFIEDCLRAIKEGSGQRGIREVVAEAVSDPAAVLADLGEPEEAGFQDVYRSDELTILNFTWAPLMTLMPHNHNMWAVIGLISGREDSILWKRVDSSITAAGASTMAPRDVGVLGPNAIHSVTNPTGKLTSALHVYGGDFFTPDRSEWDPETLVERRYNFDGARKIFREANERFRASQTQ